MQFFLSVGKREPCLQNQVDQKAGYVSSLGRLHLIKKDYQETKKLYEKLRQFAVKTGTLICGSPIPGGGGPASPCPMLSRVPPSLHFYQRCFSPTFPCRDRDDSATQGCDRQSGIPDIPVQVSASARHSCPELSQSSPSSILRKAISSLRLITLRVPLRPRPWTSTSFGPLQFHVP